MAGHALRKRIPGAAADAGTQKPHHVASQFHAVLHHRKDPGGIRSVPPAENRRTQSTSIKI